MDTKKLNKDFEKKRFNDMSLNEVIEAYLEEIDLETDSVSEIKFEMKNGRIIRRCYIINGQLVCF